MFRRIFNTVIETTFQIQPECIVYPSPFKQTELAHLGWLPSVAPCFPVKASDVRVLSEPKQFYDTLVENCGSAKHRITLVSLYLGTGNTEKKLIEAIKDNPNFKSSLRVNVLLDYMRGSRDKVNSRLMVKPLLDDSDKCRVALYHTPELRGLKKRFAPDRWNELFGLQHMKLYIFDDTLIISGANLSNDYFTNRQDRYFVINDKNLSDFYCDLVGKVETFSLRVDRHDELYLNDGWSQLPYRGAKSTFVRKAGETIGDFLQDAKEIQNAKNYTKDNDTWIFPLVQMGQLGVRQDACVTTRLLADAPDGARMHIATGYFNLTHEYMNTIMRDTKARCRLLMAHPNANGFLGAKGMAGGIPDAYCLIAQRFSRELKRLGQHERVTLQEYLRNGWTYHAKGLWYYPVRGKEPCLTLIGSPNFGERSVKRDLETQLAIVTENPTLKGELHKECSRIYELGLPANTNRNIPVWVHAMVFFFRGYF